MLANIITRCVTYLIKCIDFCKNNKSYIINLFLLPFIITECHYYIHNFIANCSGHAVRGEGLDCLDAEIVGLNPD
jgi:hypothetical protein